MDDFEHETSSCFYSFFSCCLKVCSCLESKNPKGGQSQIAISLEEFPSEQSSLPPLPPLPLLQKRFSLPQTKADPSFPLFKRPSPQQLYEFSPTAVTKQPTRSNSYNTRSTSKYKIKKRFRSFSAKGSPHPQKPSDLWFTERLDEDPPLLESSATFYRQVKRFSLSGIELPTPLTSRTKHAYVEESDGKQSFASEKVPEGIKAPEIQLSLLFDVQFSSLTIRLEKVCFLPTMANRGCFIVVYLLPYKKEALYCHVEGHGTSSELNQLLVFKLNPADDIKQQTLVLQLYRRNIASGDLIGSAILPLSDAHFSHTKYTLQVHLGTENVQVSIIIIMFQCIVTYIYVKFIIKA